MKIIALIPFKNEAIFLPTCLSSLKPICDEIICIDDNSTDNSKEIALAHGCSVYTNDKLVTFGWSEHHIRENLLRLGREAGGTHFICLDADEAISSQFLTVGKSIISKLKPGQKLGMQWLALWKCLDHYRDDYSVWSNNFKDFIVCDDEKIAYPFQWLHVGRTPGENNDNTFLQLNNKYGSVLHYQFSDWKNFQIKQSYLRCTELIKKPGLEDAINQQYSITMEDPNVCLKAMPDSWTNKLTQPIIPEDYICWRLEGIKKYFEEYGPEHFKKLQIWHVKEIKELVNG